MKKLNYAISNILKRFGWLTEEKVSILHDLVTLVLIWILCKSSWIYQSIISLYTIKSILSHSETFNYDRALEVFPTVVHIQIDFPLPYNIPTGGQHRHEWLAGFQLRFGNWSSTDTNPTLNSFYCMVEFSSRHFLIFKTRKKELLSFLARAQLHWKSAHLNCTWHRLNTCTNSLSSFSSLPLCRLYFNFQMLNCFYIRIGSME